MVAIPGYSGPTAKAFRFTVGAYQCAIDYFFDAKTPAGRIVLAELESDGLWHFLGDYAQSALMTVPIVGVLSTTPAGWITLLEGEGPTQFLYPLVPQINTILAEAFPGGAGRPVVGGDVTIPSAGLFTAMTMTVSQSSPPVLAHP